jgi:hypothetical protein
LGEKDATRRVRVLPRRYVLSICKKGKLRVCIELGFLLALVLVCSKANAGDLAPIHIGIQTDFYADNTEYSNRFRKGETLFGAYSLVYLSYCHPRFDLSLGGFYKRDYGDEKGVTDALPLFRFRYLHDWFTYTAGFLDSSNNHGLPDAILIEQYPFIYPVEEGMQFKARYGDLVADVWVNWYLRDTTNHREFFAAGFNTTFCRDIFVLELGGRVSHHGGQIYDTGLVSDSFAGLMSIGCNGRAASTDLGLALTAMGDIDRPERPSNRNRTEGYGVQGEAFVSPWGWKLYYQIFSGNCFRVEQGDPIYQTEKALHRFGICHEFRLENFVTASLKAEGVSIESNLDYNYSVVITVFLDLVPFH